MNMKLVRLDWGDVSHAPSTSVLRRYRREDEKRLAPVLEQFRVEALAPVTDDCSPSVNIF